MINKYFCLCMYIDAVAFSSARFGPGIGTIYLDSVSCSGSENRLIDCTRGTFVSCSSGHNEDAGVRCQIEGLLFVQKFVFYFVLIYRNWQCL